ncbi:MAG TPA: HipA domain-containing protein [Gammaproteobacteria bacterium]|nr:HipA domain-containing protein [Gammaproteobacteria bacterium]
MRYPQGAREKSAIFCPAQAPHQGLVANHRYLFKYSVTWALDQFWTEIAAYRVGQLVGVTVPPAYAAYIREESSVRCGALIEWFYDYPESQPIRFTLGGDHLTDLVEQFDREKGTKHNLRTIITYCRALTQRHQLEDDWLEYWAKVLTFDALIGNTDRHQDNWGFLWQDREGNSPLASFAPAFDNGTSMGYELKGSKLDRLNTREGMEAYVAKGLHHMRWELGGARLQHAELLAKLSSFYPRARDYVLECLNSVVPEDFDGAIHGLTQIETPQPLTPERADLMARLLRFRHAALLTELD